MFARSGAVRRLGTRTQFSSFPTNLNVKKWYHIIILDLAYLATYKSSFYDEFDTWEDFEPKLSLCGAFLFIRFWCVCVTILWDV